MPLIFNLKLTEHKKLAEKALEAKNTPLQVALDCLSIREHRVAIDLVRDEVEDELQKVTLSCSTKKHLIFLYSVCIGGGSD